MSFSTMSHISKNTPLIEEPRLAFNTIAKIKKRVE